MVQTLLLYSEGPAIWTPQRGERLGWEKASLYLPRCVEVSLSLSLSPFLFLSPPPHDSSARVKTLLGNRGEESPQTERQKGTVVNGVNIENLRHSEVVAFIKSGGKETRLLVVDPETDDNFKRLGGTPKESHVKEIKVKPIINGSSQPQTNGKSKMATTPSPQMERSSPDTNTQVPLVEERPRRDALEECGLRLSTTAAEAKEKALSKRTKKRAPQMDWTKKHEIFSNF
ncbi:hypothetical protein JZ751_028832 [Albula glossodonta]|uniref:EBP50 C-terminal domain-containing protein n=1 Tax=Albula glossodonta TaxID=121402 RepID=A0A8T2NES7_9TELE|nr:hypothetical protein JZ751_028832 [Albula glossodonta]